MPSESHPGQSWRPTVSHPVLEEPTGPRWRREAQGGDGGRWPRRLLIAGLLGAFLLCTGLLIWASFWLFPPQPAGLVLIGAGYETNLAVPPNVHGRESMKELAAWAGSQPASFSWRSGLLKLKPEPIELQKNAAWDTALNRVNEKTVVLYFAMHGASDAVGPYLLRQDADGRDRDANRLRLSEVLERLKKLPARTNKVVLLDATQIDASWPLGFLHNDFARALEKLDADIAAVPNLVVLSASGPDQRSWASDDLRRTLFSYYVLEGLKGAADANEDGRIDALELHTFVTAAVERWVRANREAVQTPVLLPAGVLGEKRASNIHLTMVTKPYRAADPAPSSSWSPPAELTKAWNNAQRLAQQTPAPEVYGPQVWQQYRAALVRYEQLLRAGDTDNAAVLAGQLPDLERQIEQAKRVVLASASGTLAMPSLAGGSVEAADVEDAKIFETLWGAGDNEAAGEWAKIQAKLPADLETRQTLRINLLERIFEPAMANAQENIEKADATDRSADRSRCPASRRCAPAADARSQLAAESEADVRRTVRPDYSGSDESASPSGEGGARSAEQGASVQRSRAAVDRSDHRSSGQAARAWPGFALRRGCQSLGDGARTFLLDAETLYTDAQNEPTSWRRLSQRTTGC